MTPQPLLRNVGMVWAGAECRDLQGFAPSGAGFLKEGFGE
jgi:hypothetical protein